VFSVLSVGILARMKSVARLVLFVTLAIVAGPTLDVGRLHAQGVTSPAKLVTTLPEDLDAYVANVMRTYEVPGLSIAIVKDGKVLLAKGYGVRRLGEAAQVDGRTLFGIASNTKIFTATALGLLVEEGKVAWDAPLITYLPWFRLSDPYVTHELTVRDLLVHRSGLGLGAGDLLWWPASTYDRKEIARRLKDIPLATSFRSAYAYDNVLYLVAGEVIEAVSGQSWEQFVSDRILKKVGMTTSNVRHSDATAGGNVAATHAKVDGAVRPIKPFDSDNTNPAGGINSNAEDMAKWMNVLLSHGQLADGSRLFSERTYRQLTALVTPMGVPELPPEIGRLQPNFVGYALGLNMTDYRGHKVAMHTGGLPGYVSKVLWIPDINFGVAVLTNQESGPAFDSIVYRITDHFLGESPYDWSGQYKKLVDRREAALAAAAKKRTTPRTAGAQPSLELSKYAGTYTDAWYGDIAIELQNGRLTMRFTKTPALVGDLEHFQHDTFIVKWRDRELRADAFVTFALNPDETIDHAKMEAVSSETDFSFDFQDLLLKPRK
jgi:CubicO group peptidase (beta-lactamase class C family)